MKVIDAVWEKRNLGVTCAEIKIEDSDTAEEIRVRLPSEEKQYTVVKIPSRRSDTLFLMSEMGYTFVETSIRLSHRLKGAELSGIQKRMSDSVDYSLMDESDIEELYSEIRAGLFSTDRVFLDPAFAKGLAANRYIGWISDEINRKTSDIYKLAYKGNSVGFFTFKEIEPNIYYPFLAGLYANYRSSGLGIAMVHKPVCEAKKREGKMIQTYMSTNNKGVITTHLEAGYFLEELEYIYVKHGK
ncbi:MAG: hypothetical protein LBL82_01820 [Oscillospiraceae bacterium]|nr:hypothetical protein [Oscillospiraceae bacterium]